MHLEPVYEFISKSFQLRAGLLVQVFLLIAALVSVPTMLFVKPYLLNKRHKQRQANLEQYGRVSRLDSEDEESGTRIQQPQQHGEEHEEFDFAEIFVHQVFCFPPTPCLVPALLICC